MSVQKLSVCIVAIVLVAASQSARGEENRPNKGTLEQMGLSGLVVVSDTDAMSVRGLGYKGSSVKVYGHSSASIHTPIGGAQSRNGYEASGKHAAGGKNGSFAGVEITTSGGKKSGGDSWNGHGGSKPTVTSITFFAGGYSNAWAH